LRNLLFASAFLAGSANGFAVVPTTSSTTTPATTTTTMTSARRGGGSSRTAPSSSSSTRLHAILELDAAIVQEMTAARFAFGMCFFGAAGVGAVGRELIPLIFGRYQQNKALVVDGENNSGKDENDDLGIWGYPGKIYAKDVQVILNNKLSAEAIAIKYNSNPDGSYYANKQKGRFKNRTPFLKYKDFATANPNANRLAVRVVFDSFANSIGGINSVAPIMAQDRIDLYKSDLSALAKQVNGSKTLGIASFVILLVLLGILDYLAIYHIWKGWFPMWEGFNNMPQSLFDASTGVQVLPEYFVNDFEVKA